MGKAARALALGCQPLLLTDCAALTQANGGGVDPISDVLSFGRRWYDTLDNAIGYAMHSSRSHAAVIRVYDYAGNVIETHQHKGEFKEWLTSRQFITERNEATAPGRKRVAAFRGLKPCRCTLLPLLLCRYSWLPTTRAPEVSINRVSRRPLLRDKHPRL